MDGATFDLEEAVLVLERTPRTLDAWLRGLPECWTTCNEGPETFSAYDVVGHLIHGERTDWIPRLEHILELGDREAFEPFDRFAQYEASRGKSLADLLDELAELRGTSLARLRACDIDDAKLALRGRHPELGHVTVRHLLATWVVHDLGHVAQIARVMSKRWSSEVGPWKPYLPVLTR
jgi:hypothetical protein